MCIGKVIVHEKSEDKDIHIAFLTGVQKYSLLTNLRTNGTLFCIIEKVKSSIVILTLYTFMLSIFLL